MRKKIKVKIIEESLWDRLPQHVKDEINGIISYEPKEMVEVVHSKWIDINGDGSLLECENCHERNCCKGNYCPDCGARMDAERREDAEIH